MNNSKKTLESIVKSINSIKEYGYEDKINSTDLEQLYKIKDEIMHNESLNEVEMISQYRNIANKIWQEYICNSEQEDGFRYLVHNIGSREYYDDFTSKVISTSLITNRQIAFYRDWAKGTPNGFIVSPKNIRTATFFDNSVDNMDSETNGLYEWMQLPYELEQDFINDAKQRGKYLSYQVKGSQEYYGEDCNEVACDDFDIVGYFFVSFGEGKLNPAYKKSKEMAETRGIPLKEIDFMQVRKENGLEPMNADMKRTLFKNMMLKWGNYLRKKNEFEFYPIVDVDFIEQNYENFAKRYTELKDSPEFNAENIIKEFRQTLLDSEVENSKKNPGYVIGEGIYIDEMTDDDWSYIKTLNPDTMKDRINKLREDLLDEDR